MGTDGEPITCATITFYPIVRHPQIVMTDDMSGIGGPCDSDGHFAFRVAPPGRFALSIWEYGYSSTVKVPLGKDMDLGDIVLTSVGR